MLAVSTVEAQQRRGPPQPEAPRVDWEAVLYAQPRLVEETIAGILPSDPEVPNVYFVGFAGWAQQDVFIREIAQAREIVEDRLGTRDRSVLLINHTMTLDELPLASVTNLDRALLGVGKVMNRDKDTLVLFLTSHGIVNIFGVQFPPLPLNHLTPPRLREMLDNAGIRNRIVIISACHSGSFIPALQDDHTVVLTASRADRVSFGCDNKSDWTFFGNALFNNALRETTSLTAAFEKAKALISQWEAAEKFEPSEPQMFIGSRAGAMLDAIARLGGTPSMAALPARPVAVPPGLPPAATVADPGAATSATCAPAGSGNLGRDC